MGAENDPIPKPEAEPDPIVTGEGAKRVIPPFVAYCMERARIANQNRFGQKIAEHQPEDPEK